MPRLWVDTIEGHRRAVRGATLDVTAALVAKHGLRAVTMSRIAEETGIGRATLYKYFPDVDAILQAWHEREIDGHLAQLAAARDGAGNGGARLRAFLETYALITGRSRGHHDAELATFLHRGQQVVRAEHRLLMMLTELVTEAAATGEIRNDIPAGELSLFCLHALAAARQVTSQEAVRRLVEIVLSGMQPR